MATNENIIWNVREGETIQDESGRRHDVPWDEIRDALNFVAGDLLKQFCQEKPTPVEVGGLKIYDESGYSYVLLDDIRSLILKRQKTQKNVPAYPARLGILAKLMYGLYLRRPEIECIVDRTGMPLEATMKLRKYLNNAISNNIDLDMQKVISYFENLGVVEHPELKYMHWPDYNKKDDWMRLFSPINESLTIFKGKKFPPGKNPVVVWINNEKPMRDVQDNSPGGQEASSMRDVQDNSPGGQDSGEASSMPDVQDNSPGQQEASSMPDVQDTSPFENDNEDDVFAQYGELIKKLKRIEQEKSKRQSEELAKHESELLAYTHKVAKEKEKSERQRKELAKHEAELAEYNLKAKKAKSNVERIKDELERSTVELTTHNASLEDCTEKIVSQKRKYSEWSKSFENKKNELSRELKK